MKEKTPIERQCALSKEVKPTAELLRFVLSPDNIITPDVDAKAEGRGVWVSLSATMIEQALKKKIFSSALKQKVEVPKDLVLLSRIALEKRLLGALGLARKAGQLVLGGAKVRSSVEKAGIIALIGAKDGAEDGLNKMNGMAKARLDQNSFIKIDFLTSEQLSMALGQENVIHGALVEGAAAKSAVERAKRLAQYDK